jgi:hypothetical protein
MDIQSLLETKPVGSTFVLTAAALGLTPRQFHIAAGDWFDAGGGPGFSVVGKPHKPSTGRRQDNLIDMLWIRREE